MPITQATRHLQEKRNKLVNDLTELNDAGTGEGGDLTTEQQSTYDKMWKDQESLGNRINRAASLATAEEDLAAIPEAGPPTAAPGTKPKGDDGAELADSLPFEVTYRDEKHLFQVGDPIHLRAQAKYGSDFHGFLKGSVSKQQLAMQVDDPSKGGVLTTTQFNTTLIQAIDDLVFIRQLSTVIMIPNAT